MKILDLLTNPDAICYLDRIEVLHPLPGTCKWVKNHSLATATYEELDPSVHLWAYVRQSPYISCSILYECSVLVIDRITAIPFADWVTDQSLVLRLLHYYPSMRITNIPLNYNGILAQFVTATEAVIPDDPIVWNLLQSELLAKQR